MKTLPPAIKIIFNIILFIIYAVLVLFGTGLILRFFNIAFTDADMVGYICLLVVFVITIIFRKFFYISLKNN